MQFSCSVGVRTYDNDADAINDVFCQKLQNLLRTTRFNGTVILARWWVGIQLISGTSVENTWSHLKQFWTTGSEWFYFPGTYSSMTEAITLEQSTLPRRQKSLIVAPAVGSLKNPEFFETPIYKLGPLKVLIAGLGTIVSSISASPLISSDAATLVKMPDCWQRRIRAVKRLYPPLGQTPNTKTRLIKLTNLFGQLEPSFTTFIAYSSCVLGLKGQSRNARRILLQCVTWWCKQTKKLRHHAAWPYVSLDKLPLVRNEKNGQSYWRLSEGSQWDFNKGKALSSACLPESC